MLVVLWKELSCVQVQIDYHTLFLTECPCNFRMEFTAMDDDGIGYLGMSGFSPLGGSVPTVSDSNFFYFSCNYTSMLECCELM